MDELKLVYERTSSRRGTRSSTSVAAALLVLSTLSIAFYSIGCYYFDRGGGLPEWLVYSFMLAWPASGAGAVVALIAVVRGRRELELWLLLGVGLAEFIGITIWVFVGLWLLVASN